jgi:hypothetical protein
MEYLVLLTQKYIIVINKFKGRLWSIVPLGYLGSVLNMGPFEQYSQNYRDTIKQIN